MIPWCAPNWVLWQFCKRMASRMLPSIYHYTTNSHTIQTVKSAKYLGLTYLIVWTYSRVTGKSNSILAFLLRNLYHCPQGLKAKAYLTCVHPIVEYAGNSLHAYYTHAVSHSLKKSSQICFQWLSEIFYCDLTFKPTWLVISPTMQRSVLPDYVF